jgi:hypothetical protein
MKKVHALIYLQTAKGLEIFRKAYENGKLIVAEVPAKFKERSEKTKLQK